MKKMMRRSRDKGSISAPTHTDTDGRTWLVLGEGAIIDALIPQLQAAFEDAETLEDPFYGWLFRSDWLDKHGYMHMRIGVHVERV